MSQQGELTAALGKALQKELAGRNTVYYDHGRAGEEGVGAISACLGEDLHRDNKLAELDIAILSPDKKAALLIEIEESADRPKTIIGDAMTICLSDQIRFKGKPLDVGEWTTLLIISRKAPEMHKDRLEEIEKRINRLIENVDVSNLKLRKQK
jgi:hypothetical protein